ncbi:MAG: hypothetical protein KAH35_05840 [Candidatus Atribacteria bacterium]|nr:hypothetical protein [Candidatus Atribacteria bacterium]
MKKLFCIMVIFLTALFCISPISFADGGLFTQLYMDIYEPNLDSEFWLEKKIGELLGIIEYSESGYKLNDKGAYLFHLVEQKYTDQYIDKTWKVAQRNTLAG